MKVLMIVGYTYPVIGGTELASYNIARKLVDLGCTVRLVARYSEGWKESIIMQLGKMKRFEALLGGRLRIYRCKRWPTMGGRFLSQLYTMVKLSWKEPPDVILGLTLVPSCFVGMMTRYLLLLKHRIPVVSWGRGSDISVTPHRKDWIGWLTRRFLKTVFRSKIVIAQSPVMKQQLIDFGCKSKKITIIGNAVAAHRNPVWKPQENSIIYVGGARPAKGLPYLIEAVNQLPTVSLTVVGGWGEQHWACKALARDNVEFTGLVKPSEVSKYLSKAAVYVQPSLNEGFPNSVLEAMSMGLPVIASKVGGLPYLLGKSGILVDSKDSNSLKDAIRRVLDDKVLAEELSLKSLKQSRKFSWEKIGPKILNVLERA